MAGGPFRIGSVAVFPDLNRIAAPGGQVQLEPKIMQVLVCLASRPGEVFTKEQLLSEVWNGTFVTEDVLTRAIGELRKVFDDNAAEPRVIETIRKSGYRLLAAPEPLSAPEPAAPGAVGAHRVGRRVMALAVGTLGVAAIVAFIAGTHRTPAPAPVRVRPLTTFPGNELDPAVSPDGSRVAFSWNGGPQASDYSIYVELVDAESPLRLTQMTGAEDRAPVWSPDGTRLAFARLSAGRCEILLVPALGGAEKSFGPCGDRDYFRMAWSPDGAWLAVAQRDDRSQLHIELLSLRTRERRTVTDPPPGILGDSTPAYSPDGTTIAFARNIADGVADIERVPARGGSPTRLTFDGRDIIGLSFSGDGRTLVFSSSRAGIYSLWRIPATGGPPIWVAGGGTKMKHPSLALNRPLMAYESWLYELNLWRISATASGVAPAAVTQSNDEWNFDPQISPDGKRVAFVSTRTGSEEIWTSGMDGARPVRLTSFGGARLETPRWSPDGRRIVFAARPRAISQIFAVDAAGGIPEPLTHDSDDEVAPSFSRDGQAIYFGSRRSGSWQIWKMNLSDRRFAQVTRAGGYRAEESPDGRFLYFSRTDAPGIWRQPVSGGEAIRVVQTLAPDDWNNWEIGSKGLYFREIHPDHPNAEVVFDSFDGKPPVHLVPLAEQGWSGFSLSPDGQQIVYSRVDRHSCDIRLIENPF
jgi:Tol biopolymer transport system component/DNA-binding winged helix-turn-helix (wHTH) protein